jgi:hypothetical protein
LAKEATIQRFPNFPRKGSQKFTQYISEGTEITSLREQTTNQLKGSTMQDKPKTKKEKKEIKLPDLKPGKDPKGGLPPDPCGPGGQRSLGKLGSN